MAIKLSSLEQKVTKLQAQLIWFRGPLDEHFSSKIIQDYATELAAHYYPKRSNPAYLKPIVEAFAADLVLAPVFSGHPHLWRYNYDDLDVLANFYKFTQPQTGYFHVATGVLPPPTLDAVGRGCALLGVDFSHVESLWTSYHLPGVRSRVAARVLETLAGIAHDHDQNKRYGFLENVSAQNLRKLKGQGKFRYLRRGRQWMALGTAPGEGTIDLRKEAAAELFGYRVEVRKEVRASVTRRQIEQAKADLLAVLEKPTTIYWRLNNVTNYYRGFHERRRFANATNWLELDRWLLRRVRQAMKAHPKTDWSVYLASKNLPGGATYLPRRTNFFWNPGEELNCPYQAIWNPYWWPEAEWLR